MVKHAALATVVVLGALALGVPAVSAQSSDSTGAGPVIQRQHHPVLQFFRWRIRRGVRAGRITPAEVATLRSDMTALRARVKEMREPGTRLTPAERREVRQSLRHINREIRRANRRD